MPQCMGPTNAYYVPLHWLPVKLMNVWFAMPNIRRVMADQLGKAYSRFGGCGIVVCHGGGNTGKLVAHVKASGAIEELLPPYKVYEQHLMANRPIPSECACLNLYYPEVNGPWREMGSEEHHPLCEWDPVAKRIWKDPRVIGIKSMAKDKEGNAFEVQRLVEKLRPDAWNRIREEYKGR